MATIRAYTTIEQSRKLAEILPLESADMYWRSLNLNGHISWSSHIKRLEPPIYDLEHYIPCWSLAALLNALPEYNLQKTDWGNKTEYKIVVTTDKGNYASKNYNNPIDACYEMILKLHELKML